MTMLVICAGCQREGVTLSGYATLTRPTGFPLTLPSPPRGEGFKDRNAALSYRERIVANVVIGYQMTKCKKVKNCYKVYKV